MSGRLEGKIALVTGAARGQGEAHVRRFVAEGAKVVARAMQRSGGGSIVNISSVDGMAGMASVIGYVASKFAVRGMTKTAAVELGPLGIRVNSVHPGGVDTPMIRPPGLEGVDYDAMFRKLPVPRCGTPEDVASLVLFLAGDESSYITGTEHVIDGGLLAGISMSGVEQESALRVGPRVFD